ncbi:hypothetical protein [Phycobacter azelaicus]|uniref:hypothetical protein n=1 Tax=Phycobacter azelaicus TaxID=2668075 RepID=UPI00186872DC|nr:hypothetical protein [Phycobacter azelaicus]MBE1297151.1 hypothetical protein [Paracoccaceae bacterium]
MDDTQNHQHLLRRAVIRAFEAAGAVERAFEAAVAAGGVPLNPPQPACGLLHGELTQECFCKQQVAALRRLAQGLDMEIESETRRWFVHDECCTSGGWQETETTARGDALWALQSALNALADRIGAVLRLMDADRMAAALLQ